jgi:hypothetical protein
MSQSQRTWRIRQAFEPNRFSCDQLVKVYEQLNPMEFHRPSAEPLSQPVLKKRPKARGGER